MTRSIRDAAPNAGGQTGQRQVLIVGRSPAVLTNVVALLRERGYVGLATNRFGEVLDEFDIPQLDLVVFGGQVPADLREQLTQQITAVNSRVVCVQGLSGIPGLLADQVDGVFSTDQLEPVPSYNPDCRALQFTLGQPADVTVTAWWPTVLIPPNPKSDSRVLLNLPLDPGPRAVQLPDDIPADTAFATVRINAAVRAFRLTAPPAS